VGVFCLMLNKMTRTQNAARRESGQSLVVVYLHYRVRVATMSSEAELPRSPPTFDLCGMEVPIAALRVVRAEILEANATTPHQVGWKEEILLCMLNAF
jgi:hypothetical protein